MTRLGRRIAATSGALLLVFFAAPASASPGDGDDFSSGSDDNSSSGSSSSDESSGSSSSSDDNSSSGSSSSDDSSSPSSSSGNDGGSSSGSTRHGDFGPLGVLVVFGFGAVMIALAFASAKQRRMQGNWNVGVPAVEPPPPRDGRRELEGLRVDDPDFSIVLFEDFVSSLYAAIHVARGRHALDALSAYLDPALARAMASSDPTLVEVRTVVVGAMEVRAVDRGPQRDDVHVTFIANYTEARKDAPPSSFVTQEKWIFTRSRGVKTHAPDDARITRCPSCGSPAEAIRDGHCPHCQRAVSTGEFDWVVTAIEVTKKESRTLQLSSGSTPARGVDRPTIVDPRASTSLTALSAKDPSFDHARFLARVGVVFIELQLGWSSRTPERFRPYVSDALFAKLTDQLATYVALGVRNVVDGARITRIELARVVSDRWFDAITVRVFVTGLDYRVRDTDGAVVAGDPQVEKPYTEYWTLIRGSAVTTGQRGDRACPSCGAALKINMAGVCEYCAAKVTSGAFDWVLSRIEQDKVYRG